MNIYFKNIKLCIRCLGNGLNLRLFPKSTTTRGNDNKIKTILISPNRLGLFLSIKAIIHQKGIELTYLIETSNIEEKIGT